MAPPTQRRGPTTARLTRDARRDQLLDAAARLVLDAGIGAVTMERVAERAGVSKALPYAHFENASHLLRSLHEREVVAMGTRIAAAFAGRAEPMDRLAAAVHTYFEVVAERGALLAALESRPRRDDEGGPDAQAFTADLLARSVGLRGTTARVAADLVQAALRAGVVSWARGTATRARVERVTTTFVLAGIRGLATGAPPGSTGT